jgi:hypothetical protein
LANIAAALVLPTAVGPTRKTIFFNNIGKDKKSIFIIREIKKHRLHRLVAICFLRFYLGNLFLKSV